MTSSEQAIAAQASTLGLLELLRTWQQEAAAEPDAVGTSSSAGIPLAAFYDNGLDRPGDYPYGRGRTATGYAEKLWVMGQYSGYGTPKQTNERFRQLLEAGQSGISIALDLPTQMGLDSDDPLADGEVGKVGVPLDTVDDLVALLDGVPLDRVRQMRTTANAIGPIFAAFLTVAFEELAVDGSQLRVMLQNDPLKEYTARGTFIFPPAAGLRLAVDVIEHFAHVSPRWEPIEFCGYHVRDSGGTAVHEVAVATANGIAYLDEAVRRGIDVDRLAHSLFLFLAAGVDVFEEAAKLRVARRIWARMLHERYGVRPENAAINLFVYTLGGALTAQEPLNNVVRVAFEALAAVLGGAQTLATSSFDEALGLPSPEAAHLALRTQQIVAHESGATRVVDPLGGSYYVEELSDRLEAEIVACLMGIVESGGAVAAIESGLVSELLGQAAFAYQSSIESGERKVVGVNVHQVDAEPMRQTFRVPVEVQREQCDALAARRASRDERLVAQTLAELKAAVGRGENSVPPLIAAARARVTIGEIREALGGIFGFYRPAAVRL